MEHSLPHRTSHYEENANYRQLLKQWDVKINFGIKTGLDKAFIIDDATKERLVKEAPQSAAIIKPLLRGRNIKRYQANRAKFWLIYARKGMKIDLYPAVHNYLQKHKKGLSEKSGTNQWYELLGNISTEAELAFKKEKLFWMDMSSHGRFAYSDSKIYSNHKAFIITGSFLKYLCAILNSAIVTWFIKNTALMTGVGLTQWKKFVVERTSVPIISHDNQQSFIRLIDHILQTKDSNTSADVGD